MQENFILLVNDDLINDKLRLDTIKLTKPQSVKVVVKSVDDAISSILSGVTDKYRMLVICEKIKDAYVFVKAVEAKSLNLGGTDNNEGKKHLGQAVYASEEDVALLKELINSGVYCYVQGSAYDKESNIINNL